ncbi:MAG: hypothetical protein ACYTE6_14960 [Planctomycetota bacterium]
MAEVLNRRFTDVRKQQALQALMVVGGGEVQLIGDLDERAVAVAVGVVVLDRRHGRTTSVGVAGKARKGRLEQRPVGVAGPPAAEGVMADAAVAGKAGHRLDRRAHGVRVDIEERGTNVAARLRLTGQGQQNRSRQSQTTDPHHGSAIQPMHSVSSRAERSSPAARRQKLMPRTGDGPRILRVPIALSPRTACFPILPRHPSRNIGKSPHFLILRSGFGGCLAPNEPRRRP